MEPTITGAMLQRAKGPELVSHLKARASATNLSPPLLTSDAPYKHGAARPLDGAEVRVGVGVRARARAPMCHPHPKSITGPPSPPSAARCAFCICIRIRICICIYIYACVLRHIHVLRRPEHLLA